MKGYKGMDENMRCRGMQFEIGKSYHVDGKIELCKNGLHFCRVLRYAFIYYNRNGRNRFFEVEAGENVIVRGDKCVTSDLTVIRELAAIEINRAFYGSGKGKGYGCGDGIGYGCGDGDGYGDGYGFRNGDGFGNSTGFGYYGTGTGNGGDGYGGGYGGNDIQKILIFKEM